MNALPEARRTQDERSRAMRTRLLEATVECLVDYGYVGTTVTQIAARAGVTRGAQVHHYRTKDDLVIAAVEHLAGRSAEIGWPQLAGVARSEDPVGALLDALWQLHQGPTFVATVELWVAARTDPALREHVGGIEPVLMAAMQRQADPAAITAGFGAAEDRDLLDAVFTAMDAMRGLILSTWHLPARRRNARWQRARQALRALFPDAERLRSAVSAIAPAGAHGTPSR